MASSTPASSRPTRSARLLNLLRRPAAFFASNWAGLLALLSVVGTVSGLAGVVRVVTDLDRYEDEPFVSVWRQVRATWRRDLPVSLLVWVVTVMGALNLYGVVYSDSATRVAVVGFLVPILWGVGVFVPAYTAAASAQPYDASRTDVLGLTATLVKRRWARALLTPVLLVALLPVLVIPPLTVAVGLSVPAWVLGEWYGVTPWRGRLDPDPDEP